MIEQKNPSNPFKKKTFEEVFKKEMLVTTKKKVISTIKIDEIKEKFKKEVKINTDVHRFSKKHIASTMVEFSKALNFKQRKTNMELNLLRANTPIKSKLDM